MADLGIKMASLNTHANFRDRFVTWFFLYLSKPEIELGLIEFKLGRMYFVCSKVSS